MALERESRNCFYGDERVSPDKRSLAGGSDVGAPPVSAYSRDMTSLAWFWNEAFVSALAVFVVYVLGVFHGRSTERVDRKRADDREKAALRDLRETRDPQRPAHLGRAA